MTTDKPKWWQSWIFYSLVGLLLLFGPYVGTYLLLGKYSIDTIGDSGGGPPITIHSRTFNYDSLPVIFFPLCWIEAQVRQESVTLDQSDGTVVIFYWSGD